MQAISYHSHVNTERQLLPANSLLVLYSCDMQQHKQGRCMLHNKPKQPLLPLIRPVHVILLIAAVLVWACCEVPCQAP